MRYRDFLKSNLTKEMQPEKNKDFLTRIQGYYQLTKETMKYLRDKDIDFFSVDSKHVNIGLSKLTEPYLFPVYKTKQAKGLIRGLEIEIADDGVKIHVIKGETVKEGAVHGDDLQILMTYECLRDGIGISDVEFFNCIDLALDDIDSMNKGGDA